MCVCVYIYIYIYIYDISRQRVKAAIPIPGICFGFVRENCLPPFYRPNIYLSYDEVTVHYVRSGKALLVHRMLAAATAAAAAAASR